MHDTLNVPETLRTLVHETLRIVAFRLARADEAHKLALLYEWFFNEAHYKDRGIVYSLEKSETWLAGVIADGSVPQLVAYVDDDRFGPRGIWGVCSYSLDDTFCEKPVAVLHTLYVIPSARRSAIGRVLVGLAVDLAQQDGACAFHAPLASGLPETRSLVNLFGKVGFEPIGVILGRRL